MDFKFIGTNLSFPELQDMIHRNLNQDWADVQDVVVWEDERGIIRWSSTAMIDGRELDIDGTVTLV